jgi:NAD(P)H-dependent FMN reductase
MPSPLTPAPDAAVSADPPRVLLLGGSRRPGSRTDAVLRYLAGRLAAEGAQARLRLLDRLPRLPYDPGGPHEDPSWPGYAQDVAWCTAVVVGSPVYQLNLSGAVKNALDYVHDMRHHPVALLERHGAAVAVADGDQAETTLGSILHCLRAMGARPLAYGVGLTGESFDGAELSDAAARARLDALARRLVQATRARTAPRPRLLDLTRGTGHG